MLRNTRRELRIRRTLKEIAKQRVALTSENPNIWVIENSIMKDESDDPDIATCLMRGWIEILKRSIPSGQLSPDGKLPDKPLDEILNSNRNIYRITESGWALINRQILTRNISILIALATLVFAFL